MHFLNLSAVLNHTTLKKGGRETRDQHKIRRVLSSLLCSLTSALDYRVLRGKGIYSGFLKGLLVSSGRTVDFTTPDT